MKKIHIVLVMIVIAVAAFVYFNVYLNGDDKLVVDKETGLSIKVGTHVGEMAPNFKLGDYKDNKVELADFRGKPVFINFWASWCPFCVNEMPLMAEIQREFGDQFVTIAINRGEDLKTVKGFSDSIGVTGEYMLLLDEEDDTYRAYGAFGMPYSVFIDAGGVIRDIKVGPLTEEDLRNKINNLIK